MSHGVRREFLANGERRELKVRFEQVTMSRCAQIP
jgi:hypothetical protein